MADVRPLMHKRLQEGPIKTVHTTTPTTSSRHPEQSTLTKSTTGPSKEIRAFLPQMDALGRHRRRGAALADSHTNDFPVPGIARISQSRWYSTRSRPKPLFRCVHDNAAGANRSAAGVLDYIWDFPLVQCGVSPSCLRRGLVDSGVRGLIQYMTLGSPCLVLMI